MKNIFCEAARINGANIQNFLNMQILFKTFRREVAKPYFYLVVCMQVYIFVSSIKN